MPDKKIRVLIVEDTLVAQKLLKSLVMSDDRFELIGVAENGKQATELIEKLKPDVVSMDILMPIMDGVEATRKIMQTNPVAVVIVSSFYQSSEIEMAMKVLEAGAVSIIPRPFGPGHSKYVQSAKQYLNTLKLMSEIKVVRRRNQDIPKQNLKVVETKQISPSRTSVQNYQALAIGASAGGPEGLITILSGLPADFPLPVFVVQHIDSHFAEGFVAWLNSSSKLPVQVAKNGEKILPGHVYLPPGDQHLMVNSNGTILTNKELPIKGLRPSVDSLFKSVAQVYGKNTLAVLLSGMGKDGAKELKNLYDLGAFTFAQDESSCLIFGMPGEAVRLGAVCKLLSPDSILIEIVNLINLQTKRYE